MSHKNKNQQQPEQNSQPKNENNRSKNKKNRKDQRPEQMQFTNRTPEANFEF